MGLCRSVLAGVTLGLLTSARVSAAPDTLWVHCEVFHDQDGDGARQAGEPGLAAMRITNGLDVYVTDPQGSVDIPVDRQDYRFATVTVPAGLWPTNPFYLHVPVGTAGTDSVSFGLEDRPESASDPVVFAHFSDTHVNTYGTPPALHRRRRRGHGHAPAAAVHLQYR